MSSPSDDDGLYRRRSSSSNRAIINYDADDDIDEEEIIAADINSSSLNGDDDDDDGNGTIPWSSSSFPAFKNAKWSQSKVKFYNDMETGSQRRREWRSQDIMIRTYSQKAQGRGARRRKIFGRKAKQLFFGNDDDDDNNNSNKNSIYNNPFWGRRRGRRRKKQHDGVVDDDDDEENNNIPPTLKTGRPVIVTEEREGEEDGRFVQYRLSTVKKQSSLKRLSNVLFSPSSSQKDYSSPAFASKFKPSAILVNYMNWTHRKSFIRVIGSGLLAFFIFTFSFAVPYYIFGHYYEPDCIHVNGRSFGGVNSTAASDFWDVYSLSWTTFSTVGYGLVYPSTSSTIDAGSNIQHCFVVALLSSLEAFVGILFASFCLAIIVAKVTRVQSVAQVQFSDPIVIRYGTGLLLPEDDDEEEEKEEQEKVDSISKESIKNLQLETISENSTTQIIMDSSRSYNSKIDDNNKAKRSTTTTTGNNSLLKRRMPCPALEFRILNKLHNVNSGEIIEATVNIIAIVTEEQYKEYFHNNNLVGYRRFRKTKKKKKRKRQIIGQRSNDMDRHNDGDENEMEEDGSSLMDDEARHNKEREERLRNSLSLSVMTRNDYRHSSIEERKSQHIKPRAFIKLEFDPAEHPYFKRIWTLTHVLDDRSPLLKAEARALVQMNHGYWPDSLNSAKGIQASIAFDHIIVKLSGTSNVDANTVHYTHVYEFDEVCVGYTFSSALYRSHENGPLTVDESRLSVIVEQNGGGARRLFVTSRQVSFARSIRFIPTLACCIVFKLLVELKECFVFKIKINQTNSYSRLQLN